MAALECLSWCDYSLGIKAGVHFTLCGGTICKLGTQVSVFKVCLLLCVLACVQPSGLVCACSAPVPCVLPHLLNSTFVRVSGTVRRGVRFAYAGRCFT